MGNVYTKSGALAQRIYFGATLIWEKATELYDLFKQRVLFDGGTFIENPIVFNDELLLLTPNAFKAGKLYSAVPNDGTGDFTVDRNSTATYIGQEGLIKNAVINEPRIDWSTGVPVVLREEQRTNLITYSENIEHIAWFKNYITITTNEKIAPDGLQTMDLIIPAVVNGRHYLANESSVTTGLYYTQTIFAERGGYDFLKIVANRGFDNLFINVNLTNGTIGFKSTGINAIVTEFGNTYKISVTLISTADSDTGRFLFLPLEFNENGLLPFTTGNGVDGIYLWGAQLEQASTASSYIPTNGATVTRLADNISVPTPAGVTSITETIGGIEQTPITTIPATYSLPVGNINKVKMQ